MKFWALWCTVCCEITNGNTRCSEIVHFLEPRVLSDCVTWTPCILRGCEHFGTLCWILNTFKPSVLWYCMCYLKKTFLLILRILWKLVCCEIRSHFGLQSIGRTGACRSMVWIKGIVSRVWEQLQWHPSDRSEEFRTAGAYFYSLFMPFSCFNSKKHAVAVSHSTVTLQMMSHSRRSLSEW